MPSVSAKNNICVLGNSHVGSLKRGWDTITDDYPDLNLTFFADRGMGLKDLEIREGKLVPTTTSLRLAVERTSDGCAEVVIEKYDGFILYGLQLDPFLLNPASFYSSAVLNAAIDDHVGRTLSLKIIKMIRDVSDVAIYVGHNPLRALMNNEVVEKVEPRAYKQGVKAINSMFYDSVGCVYVSQPLCSIVNRRFTHPIFASGSKRLSVGAKNDDELHSERDWRHMNDNFGVLWLKNFIENDL